MLLGFAALAVFTALSIIWSLSPGGLLARGQPHVRLPRGVRWRDRWRWRDSPPSAGRRCCNGVSLGCVLVCVWALTTKVFPGALAADETYRAPARAVRLLERGRPDGGARRAAGAVAGRAPLRPPGRQRARVARARAALHVPDAVLLARRAARAADRARATGSPSCRCACAPPLPLVVAAAASAPVVGWAFARDALSAERMPLAARTDAGHELGALLRADGRAAAGGRAGRRLPRRPASRPRRATRRVASRALLAILALHPAVAVVVAVGGCPAGSAARPRRRGTSSRPARRARRATRPNRLTATSSVRARYWGEAMDDLRGLAAVGAGAGAFVVARTRYRTDKLAVRHAHGYGVQTLADLGLIGLALSLVAPVAWAVAALRVTGLRRRDRGLPFDPERDRAGDDDLGRRRVRGPLADRLDLVRARQRGRRAAVRRLGRGARAAAPTARGGRPAAAPPRGRRARLRAFAAPSRRRSACSARRARRELGGAAAGARGARRGRGDRPPRRSATTTPPRAGARAAAAPQSAVARPAVAAGLHRRRPRRQAHAPPARSSGRRGASRRTPRRGGGSAATGCRCSRTRRARSRPSRPRTSSTPRRCAPPPTCSRPRARSRPRAEQT